MGITAISARSTDSRPRLLFLSQTLPFPPDGGVKIRTFHTLRCLAKVFDVTALCFYRSKPGILDPRVEEALSGLSSFGKVHAFPIPQEQNRLRFLLDHARSALSRRVYTVFSYESATYKSSLVDQLTSGTFDLVHLDSLDLSGYLPLLDDLPTVCVHHDAQSLLLRRRAQYEERASVRRYIQFQADLMEKEERELCPKFDLNVTVSEIDRKNLRKIAPTANFKIVPNGVDINFFKPNAAPESGLVFVGGTSWYPNRDALSFYHEKILPAIRARCGDIHTLWVGRASEEEIRTFTDSKSGLQLTGYVEDIRPHVAAAACYIVPLRIGGGTRIKILDAWAMGKAVVSTSIGCEGLDARHENNILIADTPERFATCVQAVLNDPVLRQRLGEAGRRTVESSYSWDAIGDGMNELYLGLIAAPTVVEGEPISDPPTG